jgi:hypothetical protein
MEEQEMLSNVPIATSASFSQSEKRWMKVKGLLFYLGKWNIARA